MRRWRSGNTVAQLRFWTAVLFAVAVLGGLEIMGAIDNVARTPFGSGFLHRAAIAVSALLAGISAAALAYTSHVTYVWTCRDSRRIGVATLDGDWSALLDDVCVLLPSRWGRGSVAVVGPTGESRVGQLVGPGSVLPSRRFARFTGELESLEASLHVFPPMPGLDRTGRCERCGLLVRELG